MSNLLASLDSKELARATSILEKLRAEYPAYPDHELLLYALTQALTEPGKRTPLPA